MIIVILAYQIKQIMRTKNVMKFFLVLCMGISTVACAQEKKDHLMSNETFKEVIETNKVQLLDVRTEKEFNEGTIEYAQNIDVLQDNFLEEANKLDKSQPLYIFCKSGKRSAKARNMLLEQGFEKVYELKEGYSKWNTTSVEN